jgi:hypothetical protein
VGLRRTGSDAAEADEPVELDWVLPVGGVLPEDGVPVDVYVNPFASEADPPGAVTVTVTGPALDRGGDTAVIW